MDAVLPNPSAQNGLPPAIKPSYPTPSQINTVICTAGRYNMMQTVSTILKQKKTLLQNKYVGD